jgi:hypothetical protein
MLSGKLVHLIESHWDQIASRVIDQVRREPKMPHIRGLAESQLREIEQVLLENLGHWLAAGNEEELAQKYEKFGKLRCEQGIPLHEAVRGLCIIREKMLDFVEEHIVSKNTLELYAEEELERRLGRFFDILTIHLVQGYEAAMRREAMIAHHGQ